MTSAKTNGGRPCFNFRLKPNEVLPEEEEEEESSEDGEVVVTVDEAKIAEIA